MKSKASGESIYTGYRQKSSRKCWTKSGKQNLWPCHRHIVNLSKAQSFDKID